MSVERSLVEVDDKDPTFKDLIKNMQDKLKRLEKEKDEEIIRARVFDITLKLDNYAQNRLMGNSVLILGEHWLPVVTDDGEATMHLDYIKGHTTGRSDGYSILDTHRPLVGESSATPENQRLGEELKIKLQEYGRFAICNLVRVKEVNIIQNANVAQGSIAYSAVAPLQTSRLVDLTLWEDISSETAASQSLDMLLEELPTSHCSSLADILEDLTDHPSPLESLSSIHTTCKSILNSLNDQQRFTFMEFINALSKKNIKNTSYRMSFENFDELRPMRDENKLQQEDVGEFVRIFPKKITCSEDHSYENGSANFDVRPRYRLNIQAYYEVPLEEGLIDLPVEFFNGVQ